MKKLSIGISDFKKLIEEGYIYVDKTKYIYELVKDGGYIFLSRPRRFGKSLLLSTIEYLFLSEKELFEGLYIEEKWNWNESYPVVRINFAKDIENKKKLIKRMKEELRKNYMYYGIEMKEEEDEIFLLEELIMILNKKYRKQVVVLIDEYDKPILDVIENKKEAEEVRKVLKSFYSVLKGLDKYLKFVLITGVSKFAKVSLFSGLNQLKDISLDKRYGNICGYTQSELEFYFKDYLKDINIEELKEWYNGYNFLKDSLYNPFDVLLYLDKKEIDSYWYNTGTPSFLIKLIKEKQYEVSKLDDILIKRSMLDKFDIEEIEIEALMFQTGYLTIKEEYKTEYGIEYKLGFPNKEVKVSFNENIINKMVKDKTEITTLSKKITEIFKEEKLEDLREQIEILFSNISYMYLKEESNYVVGLFSLLYASGLNVITEDNTSKGRIDLTVIVNKKIVYILEFKVITKEEEKGIALKQIREKEYFKKYLNYERIYLIGIEFDKNKKNISHFKYEIIK